MRNAFVPGLVLCAALGLPAAAAQDGAPRGTTYDSMKTLPDWRGAWAQDYGPPVAGQPLGLGQQMAEIPPLKDPKALADYKTALAKRAKGGDNIAAGGGGLRGTGALHEVEPGGAGCGWYGGTEGAFSGRLPGGPETLLEFIFSLGRVTITSDHGLIRRIYTDGREVPDDPFITTTGTSIGHWEGNTLVVHTVGLSPKTQVGGGLQMPSYPAGKGFAVDERMYLDDRQELHVDTTMTAPDIFSGPYHFTMIYRRLPDRDYMLAEYVTDCSHKDRAVDPVAKKQMFDTTPPIDLPPPPAD